MSAINQLVTKVNSSHEWKVGVAASILGVMGLALLVIGGGLGHHMGLFLSDRNFKVLDYAAMTTGVVVAGFAGAFGFVLNFEVAKAKKEKEAGIIKTAVSENGLIVKEEALAKTKAFLERKGFVVEEKAFSDGLRKIHALPKEVSLEHEKRTREDRKKELTTLCDQAKTNGALTVSGRDYPQVQALLEKDGYGVKGMRDPFDGSYILKVVNMAAEYANKAKSGTGLEISKEEFERYREQIQAILALDDYYLNENKFAPHDNLFFHAYPNRK